MIKNNVTNANMSLQQDYIRVATKASYTTGTFGEILHNIIYL
jgi:hypothetical protein